jgi:TonB family protein
MNFSSVHLLTSCTLATMGFLTSAGTLAQVSKLDDASSQLAKQLKPLKPRLIAVVDFCSPEGEAVPLGHYFASTISDFLQQHEKKSHVAEHAAFDADLANLRISCSNLVPGPSLQAAAPHLGTDFLVIGTIQKRNNSYVLQFSPVRVADGNALKPTFIEVEASEFLDSFARPLPPGVLHLNRKVRNNELDMPLCQHCPDPSYTGPGRHYEVQGTAILEVLISTNGNAQQIRPVRLLGYGLDEQAFDAIKKWRFKPATLRKDGTPVAVIIPVEITFRLF